MPFCPVCLSEFREGFERCNACDVELVSQLEEKMDLSEVNIREAMEGKELIAVTRGDLDVVKETRDLLAAERVASIIVPDEEAPAHPGMPSRVVLVVAKNELERAMAIIGDRFKNMVEVEGKEVISDQSYESCPACGSKVSADAEECADCGLFVGKG